MIINKKTNKEQKINVIRLNRVREIEFIKGVNNFQILWRTKQQILFSLTAVYLAVIITQGDYNGQICSSYFKLRVCWLSSLTPVTYLCKLLGICCVAAFP
ncbi:hypothetical protein FDX19_23765 [Citrobacter sp. wls619]|nr:hypothetical protein FDX19_23765 [Citrobacter sp. wls619]